MLTGFQDLESVPAMTQSDTARARSNLYALLAAAFRAEPTLGLLREIRKPVFREALAAAGVALGANGHGYEDQRLLDELAQEFTRLFIGPGGHIPPYAGIHLGGDWASLWGPDTVWVKDFIENAGFSYRTDYNDLPDHISVELEFMRELTAREAAALEAFDMGETTRLRGIESAFINEHLLRWIPAFCDRVSSHAEKQFYKGMAGLMKEFIESEQSSLKDCPQLPNADRRKK
jgi:putative dimethyl sulfoxide reductase chaperone